MILGAAACLTVLLLGWQDEQNLDCYVAPGASPEGDGSVERPLASLEAARDRLRAQRLGQATGKSPARIVLLPGRYFLHRSFELGPQDRGLQIVAAPGAKPILMGGTWIEAPELQPVEDPQVLRRLPDDAARKAVRCFRWPEGLRIAEPEARGMGRPTRPVSVQILANGQALIPARWPNQGFVEISEVLDPGSIPRNRAEDIPADQREQGPPRGGRFRFDHPRMAHWAQVEQAWALGYWHWDWAEELLPVASIDSEDKSISLGLPHRYGLKKGGRFYLCHLLEELDAPGEFALDVQSRCLYLWPPEPLDSLYFSEMAEPLVRLRDVDEVLLRGLRFEGSRGQAVVAEKVEGLRIEQCQFRHIGNYSVRVQGRSCVIIDNDFQALGAGAIAISGGNRMRLEAANNKVLWNRIEDFGRVFRTYRSAIGISGVGQIVAGNRIRQGPHSGIIFSGNDHRIERNEISEVLLETGDCGAIYCGRDWTFHGNRIAQNYIHDLPGAKGRWQNAIYLDDMASGITVEGNLIQNCHWGMLIGGGRDLNIRGNQFVDCKLGLHFDARGVGWMASHIADPETSTLHRRWVAMPVAESPWKDRFPSLQNYLSHDFGRPAGSAVTGNQFWATPFGNVEDREAVLVTENQVHQTPPPKPLRPPISLVEAGESLYSIVLADSAPAIESEAARMLQEHVESMTGAKLPIVFESRSPEARRIFVGRSNSAQQQGWKLETLQEDGFLLKTVGEDLYLVGGSQQGISYAVSSLLEHWGCRYWAPGMKSIPELTHISLPADFHRQEIPKVWFRHVNYGPALDPAYRQWHKLDRIQEEVGRLWAPHWVHSMFDWVPPEKYFEQYPEYFALVGGERRASQLCLTNPEVLRRTIEAISAMLRQHPEVRYISVSQEDNYEHCQCPEAQALLRREGSAMAETLQFVNAVAETFPDRIISTLAYQYTRKPPRFLRPRENVSIMLCTIEEDRSRPIMEQEESRFPEDFRGWTAICDDVFLWDYEVQFASPVAPFPNLRVLQPNVRWFVDHGVRHLFLQGNGRHTEMAELRCYLLAKLAWNAEVDVESLIQEFLQGFYGPAASELQAYLDLLHREMEASQQPLLIYGHPSLAMDTWLRPEVLTQAKQWFDQAERKVTHDPELARRVRTARLPLFYAELEIAKRRGLKAGGIYQPAHGDSTQPWQVRSEIRDLLDQFLQGLEAVGIRRLREMDLSVAEYRQGWQELFDLNRLQSCTLGTEIQAQPSPSPKYAAGDPKRLVDGMPGGDQCHENWIGWEGEDSTITLNLGRERLLDQVQVAFLQDPKSWIWLPKRVELWLSEDGDSWQSAAVWVPMISDRIPMQQTWKPSLGGQTARWVKLQVEGIKTCPDWHIGAGQKAWFFVDEISMFEPSAKGGTGN
ncbi:MAG: DUF4838 domain-containing protein [Planctomycetota bacterium]|nr:MAG: DUF4838 domain-containing protein [Planctomycetota bacterium]